MINVEPLNEEVLYAADEIVQVKRQDISELVAMAVKNPRKRVRICSHRGVGDKLHEMLIVHTKETYVRPHKHLGKSESFHVIEGEVDVVVFDEAGKIFDVISLGDYPSGKTFYYRIADPLYHTLLIRSDIIVFHETTNGPFRYEDMVFAPWEPEPEDATARREFIENLDEKVARFRAARSGQVQHTSPLKS